MRAWASLRELFDSIPKDCVYLVLRNYETLESGQLLDEHADIDVLCRDPRRFVRLADATPRQLRDDRIHYKLAIAGQAVALDVRTPGDGYYDAPWAEALLAHRRFCPGGCYVPDPEDYYYSLLYHALIHKNALSEEYRARLTAMATSLGLDARDMPAQLNAYMRGHSYGYTCPRHPHGIFNTRHADPALVKRDPLRLLHRFIAQKRRRLSKLLKGR